jgi:hypothetical protein
MKNLREKPPVGIRKLYLYNGFSVGVGRKLVAEESIRVFSV